jgi:hypothetical protein
MTLFLFLKLKTQKIANYLQRITKNINIESVKKLILKLAPFAIKYLIKKTLIRLVFLAYIAYNAIVIF